jgi:POT family proton-dependent oligopeptide transporter
MTTNDSEIQLDTNTILGHPKGLFYLFFAELWERFSFYGMRALLTLYMVNVIFLELVERDFAAAAVYASYGSLVYASTVVGGRISRLSKINFFRWNFNGTRSFCFGY